MKPVVVSDVLAVGEFPTDEQIEILAKAGFKSVINTQPDGEVARFPSSAAIAATARRHGLDYAYAPLSSRTPPPVELAAYAAALSALKAPIYAFCYSGSRAAAACALILARHVDVDDLVKDFAEAGFDIEGLRPWLDEERARAIANGGNAPAAPMEAVEQMAGRASPKQSANGASAEAADGGRKPMLPGLPRMVVVHPRAAGFSGFAV